RGAHAGWSRIRATLAAHRSARCGVLAGSGHGGAHSRQHRDSARRAHRVAGHAILSLAAVARRKAERLNMSLLEVDNLSYGFRGKRVGEAFTFSLRENEAMAVLGPNG